MSGEKSRKNLRNSYILPCDFVKDLVIFDGENDAFISSFTVRDRKWIGKLTQVDPDN